MHAPAPLTAGLPLPGAPPTQQPAVIAIPGNVPKRTARRSATNPLARLSAYVVPDASLAHAPSAALNVAIKANARLLGLSLKGHKAPIVDLEFLQTPATDPVHVLGSCDENADVFLWFLYVETDSLRVPVALRLLRKYSFYTLRTSVSAFYSRIRLAGSAESGTMVLVPNYGGNVRVVTFHCEHSPDAGPGPAMPTIAPPPSKQQEDTAALPLPTATPLAVSGAAADVQLSKESGEGILERADDDGVGAGAYAAAGAAGAAAVGGGIAAAAGVARADDAEVSVEEVREVAVDVDVYEDATDVAAGAQDFVGEVEYEVQAGVKSSVEDKAVESEHVASRLGDEYAEEEEEEEVEAKGVQEQEAKELEELEDEEDEEEEEEEEQERELEEEEEEQEKAEREEEEEMDSEEEEFEASANGLVVGN